MWASVLFIACLQYARASPQIWNSALDSAWRVAGKPVNLSSTRSVDGNAKDVAEFSSIGATCYDARDGSIYITDFTNDLRSTLLVRRMKDGTVTTFANISNVQSSTGASCAVDAAGNVYVGFYSESYYTKTLEYHKAHYEVRNMSTKNEVTMDNDMYGYCSDVHCDMQICNNDLFLLTLQFRYASGTYEGGWSSIFKYSLSNKTGSNQTVVRDHPIIEMAFRSSCAIVVGDITGKINSTQDIFGSRSTMETVVDVGADRVGGIFFDAQQQFWIVVNNETYDSVARWDEKNHKLVEELRVPDKAITNYEGIRVRALGDSIYFTLNNALYKIPGDPAPKAKATFESEMTKAFKKDAVFYGTIAVGALIVISLFIAYQTRGSGGSGSNVAKPPLVRQWTAIKL